MLEVRGDRVIVKPLEDPDKIGHIFVPEIAKGRADQGIVLFTGPRVRFLEVGDLVMYSAYSGTNVTIEGEGTCTILREVACLCKIHAPNTDIAGLYHRDRSGEYFSATYESCVDCLRATFQSLPWRANILGKMYVKRDTLKAEEYDLTSEDEEIKEFYGNNDDKRHK